ncbi:MAG: hypothetical protein V1787_02695 [Candidatus Micrarchaeota archaeon]
MNRKTHKKGRNWLRSRAMFMPEMFRPTLPKLTVSLLFMAVLFLSVLIDLPDWLFGPLTMGLAWPLLWLTSNCNGEKVCTDVSSFVGLMLSLFYWYFTASLVTAILQVVSRHETKH